MATYDKGDSVRLSATFQNTAGEDTDPTTILCKIQTPGGSAVTYTYGQDAALVRDDTGDYHLDLFIDESGNWRYRWEGTGAVTSATETRLFALPSRL